MTDTTPKPFVFVLMPFDAEFDDVYKLGIKPACQNAGSYAERVDEQIFQESILDRIYNQIAKADVIVSDLSGRNENVFYETGYAHALGKTVILLTKTEGDIPFDLKHYPHIIYGGRISELLPELEKRIRYIVNHPSGTLLRLVNNLDVQVCNTPLSTDKTIVPTIALWPDGRRIAIDIHNSAEREIRIIEYQVALIAPSRFGSYSSNDDINMVYVKKRLTIYQFTNKFRTLPGAWETVSIEPIAEAPRISKDEQFEFAIRISTEAGCFDYPFTVVRS